MCCQLHLQNQCTDGGLPFLFLSKSQYIRQCSILTITGLQSEQNTAPALLQRTY